MDARAADPPTLGRPDPLLSRYTVPPQGLGDEGSRNAGLCPPGFPAACTPLCVTAELGVTLCGSTACGCGPGGEQARDRAVSECAGSCGRFLCFRPSSLRAWWGEQRGEQRVPGRGLTRAGR